MYASADNNIFYHPADHNILKHLLHTLLPFYFLHILQSKWNGEKLLRYRSSFVLMQKITIKITNSIPSFLSE
ncbi:hypothetical protein ASF10_09925 [Flavobacterium sp. Leaf82]|nr:hypothetical protein ASF10_09925 [Flavobacterium sp. Leaf82]